MKKIIFGAALMICGMISGCSEYLAQKILFAAPSVSVVGQNYLFAWGGPILFFLGLVLCLVGLLANGD